MSKLTADARALAAQENNDEPEHDMLMELSERIDELELRITWAIRVKRSGMVGFVGDMLRGNWELLDVQMYAEGSFTLRDFVEATEKEDHADEIKIN